MTQNTPRQTDGRLTVQNDLDIGTGRLVATWEMDALSWAEGNVDVDYLPKLHVYIHDVNEGVIPHKDHRVEASVGFEDAPTAVQKAFVEQMGRIADLRESLLDTPVDDENEWPPESLLLEEQDGIDTSSGVSTHEHTYGRGTYGEAPMVDEAVNGDDDDE